MVSLYGGNNMEDYIGEIVKLTNMSQYKPLNQIVYEGIRKAIISGRIPVNERINIKEYAERLNISRTPIREALRMLEKEGLVEYVPKYGVVVKKISVEDVKEIYKIRIALDVLAFVNAMNIMDEEQFKQLEDLLNETEIAHRNHQIEEVTRLFSKFNEMIYNFSQMPRLKSIVMNLREYLARFRDISMSGEARRRRALDEHWMIYRAMKNKDEKQLRSIIKEHLGYSEQYVLREMEKIDQKKSQLIKNKTIDWAHQLAIYAQQALLYEAVLFPKPGLVDPVDNGAHDDMDIYTLMDSISCLYGGFHKFALKGLSWDENPRELFHVLRTIGIDLERRMFRETKNVNTHKGAIFSMGIFLAAAGMVLQEYLDYYDEFPIFEERDTEKVFHVIRNMTKGLVADDFKDIHHKKHLTHGEKLYLKYGFTGIRGEAEAGYPIIKNIILPRMRSQDKQYSIKSRLHEILFLIMATVDDSNVVHRGGIEALDLVKREANNLLEKVNFKKENACELIDKMNDLLVEKNISPGGSADLLSVSIFLGKLENII